MKTKQVLVLLLATIAVTVTSAADSSGTPAPRPRLTKELRQRAETSSRNTANADDGTVQLEPVEVKGDAHLIYREPQVERPADHPFNWRDGGTFLRRDGRHFTTRIGFQYNPDAGGFNILSFSW